MEPRPTASSRTRSHVSLSGTNLERAGDYNQRVTLQAIRVHGNVTRADLVELTGLTAPSITNITKRLLDENLIVGAEIVRGRRGQPPTLLAINPDGCFSIGVNIDRDHITIVVLDLIGKVRLRASLEVDFALPETARDFFRTSVKRMLSTGDIDRERIVGVGVAIPDRLSTIELPNRPASYSAWDRVDIPSLFSGLVPGGVLIENDATAAALGELQFGHGLREPSFFYLLISAGLGGGLVIDGMHFRGAHGRSGEIGFLPLRSRFTSATDLGQAVSLSGLYDVLRGGGYETSRPEGLESLDHEGQRLVEQWVNQSADFLADPLVAVFCLVDPQAVFIGGRLPSGLVDRLADRLNERLKKRGRGIPVIAPVRRAAMAADAPAVGAALLPLNDQLLPTRAALMKMAGG